ncbi:hypothetical protein L9F63_023886, partial [Diploptera punctata]
MYFNYIFPFLLKIIYGEFCNIVFKLMLEFRSPLHGLGLYQIQCLLTGTGIMVFIFRALDGH